MQPDGISDRIIFSKTFGNGIAKGEDIGGHGTHVTGIIASSDTEYTGVAPGANIIALKVFDSPGASVEKALQWCVANADEYSIDVINMSLSTWSNVRFQNELSYYLAEFGYDDEFDALESLGIICVASAGNSYAGYLNRTTNEFEDYYEIYGPGVADWNRIDSGVSSIQGVSAPSAYSNVISVGATWASDAEGLSSIDAENPGSLTYFSQRDDELLDLVAYGGGVTSAAIGGGTVVGSGTSMSAPYVSGLVLLMQQAAEQELGRKLSFDEVKTIINNYSDTTFDGDDEVYNYRNTIPSNETYNVASINNWLDYIVTLKDPLQHYVDLRQGIQDYNFGLKSSSINSFTDASEQILVTAAETITNAGGGNDRVTGSDGTDTLYGGDGADIIYAGTGDDIIYGNAGDDILYGVAGADTFHYTRGDGNDLLADFDQSDVIEYHGYSDAEKSLFSESVDADGNTVITLVDGASITKLSQGNNAPTGTINISGDIKQGATISAVTSLLSDADGVGTLRYQWLADGVAILNATDDKYTLTQTEVGKSISLKVNYLDGLGNSEEVTSSSSSAVANVNDVPVLTTSSSLSTNEDIASAAIAFSATDVDGDTLIYSFSDPAKGSITNNNNGTYFLTPYTNANGSDSFTITVNDGTVDVSESVEVTINAVNDVPVLTTSSTLSTNEDTVSAAIAFSATDVDGDTLTYSFSDPAKGSVVNNNDGTYTYTPDANENGSDSFTITVNDGTADVSQTVNVKINTVTNIPVIHYDLSGDAPQFIGVENLEVISLGDPDFSYSYKNTSDTTDVTDLEFTGDLQNVSFKFLDTEIPLFDTSGGLPPLDTGIERFTNETLETIDILWAHAHPTNSSLSYTEDADYLGSFMLLLDQKLPDISNQEEFMEFASSVGPDIVQIPDSVVYGPGNSDCCSNHIPLT